MKAWSDDGDVRLDRPLTDAERDLVDKNARIATFFAKHYFGRAAARGIRWDDLLQECLLGLMDAAPRFDPARGTKFGTYARGYIQNRVRALFRGHALMITLAGEISEEDYKAAERPVPPAGRDDEANLLHGPRGTVIVNWGSEAVRREIRAALDRDELTADEWSCFCRRRGLFSDRVATQDEAAFEFGVTRATVRNRERSAAAKLYRVLA